MDRKPIMRTGEADPEPDETSSITEVTKQSLWCQREWHTKIHFGIDLFPNEILKAELTFHHPLSACPEAQVLPFIPWVLVAEITHAIW